MGTRDSAIDAALALCDVAESLRHPKHARLIAGPTEQARYWVAAYFLAQKQALVHWLKYRIGEASRDAKRKSKELLPDDFSPLTFAVTAHEEQGYRAALASAIDGAASQLAEGLGTDVGIPNTAMERYLRRHSLSQLVGELESTSKQRLRDAIADAVDAGADADGIVGAIERVMDNFGGSRAQTIAQTEVNSAYNYGRHEIASSAGMTEKAWVTESDLPCLVCVGNQVQGWIPIEDEFLSGDQYPTAHPNCYCSVDFRLVSK